MITVDTVLSVLKIIDQRLGKIERYLRQGHELNALNDVLGLRATVQGAASDLYTAEGDNDGKIRKTTAPDPKRDPF